MSKHTAQQKAETVKAQYTTADWKSVAKNTTQQKAEMLSKHSTQRQAENSVKAQYTTADIVPFHARSH